VTLAPGQEHTPDCPSGNGAGTAWQQLWQAQAAAAFATDPAPAAGIDTFWRWLSPRLTAATWEEVQWGLDWLAGFALQGDHHWAFALATLNRLRDRIYPLGHKKRASLLTLVDATLETLFASVPCLGSDGDGAIGTRRLTWDARHALRAPATATAGPLLLDTEGFPAEGEDCAANWLVRACNLGWRHLIAYKWRGGRFAGSGLGPDSSGVRDVGDYAASGLHGAELHLHGDGQDQLGQIMKRGKLVVHGDVGQTFLYGAKGGDIYVRGSAAGRPLINAVGRPRAVINGTCLDYLAESFMAGDPLAGGGFVILNGVAFGEDGRLADLPSPYPGGNLFSLASGGAIYIRDPHRRVVATQLNGGRFAELAPADWALLLPYLRENERLFGIRVDDLLTVDGQRREPHDIYRKVVVVRGILNETENR
jgi:hypothetical protein